MARINVEDDFWTHPRYRALTRLVGDEDKAAGMCIRAWRIAQRFWGEGKVIPDDVWKLENLDALLDVGLAEKRDGGVYCRGSEKHFEWYCQAVDSGRRGGLKSAIVRAEKYGTALPPNARNLPKDSRSNPSKATEGSPKGLPNPLTLTLALTPSLTHKDSPNGESQDSVSARVPFQEFSKAWTDHCGVLSPRTLKLTDERRRKIKARWAEVPDLAYWADCARRMAASSFCCEGAWASFDWLVKNDTNHVKVAEGKYDNRDSAGGGLTAADWADITREDPR